MLNLSRVILRRSTVEIPVRVTFPTLFRAPSTSGFGLCTASSASPNPSSPSTLRLSDGCVQRLQQLRQAEPETMLRIIVGSFQVFGSFVIIKGFVFMLKME